MISIPSRVVPSARVRALYRAYTSTSGASVGVGVVVIVGVNAVEVGVNSKVGVIVG
jgi:hypothetical protein